MSKYTHKEWLCEALYEFGRIVDDELILGDNSDDERDDPKPSSCGGDEEDLGDALEVGG